jgi:hypothetical protein
MATDPSEEYTAFILGVKSFFFYAEDDSSAFLKKGFLTTYTVSYLR